MFVLLSSIPGIQILPKKILNIQDVFKQKICLHGIKACGEYRVLIKVKSLPI